MNILAPIVLFVYSRPELTRFTVEALQRNHLAQESDLYIYSDAAKHSSIETQVAEVRKYIKSISGFHSITIIERKNNFGLSNSIISGVTEIIEKFERIIVLEDDLITSPFFLQYMNDALIYYTYDERVISIHGYVYPVKQQLQSTFFLTGTDCWGWGTWNRGWKLFNPDGRYLLNALKKKNLAAAFDFDNSYKYTKMLKNQIAGKIDSWAVRWHASAFIEEKLTLFPGISLVNNIGESDSATHTKSLQEFQTSVAQEPISLGDIVIEENNDARLAFIQFFRSIRQSFFQKFYYKLKSIF